MKDKSARTDKVELYALSENFDSGSHHGGATERIPQFYQRRNGYCIFSTQSVKIGLSLRRRGLEFWE